MGYVITQMGFLKLPRLAGVEERFPAEFTELYGRPLNSYFFSLEGLKIIFKLSMGMCRGNSIARFLFFVKLGYSRPLNITGLHCVGPLIRRSFQKTVGLLYTWVSHPRIPPALDGKQYFRCPVGNLWTQRAD